jgi:hypothetical protein
MQAIEYLERVRGPLLWADLRGFCASIDQTRTVSWRLAEVYTAVDRKLEMLTTRQLWNSDMTAELKDLVILWHSSRH